MDRRAFARKERNMHCDVGLHLAPVNKHILPPLDSSSSSSQLSCRAAFNAAYSHTGGQARELVRS